MLNGYEDSLLFLPLDKYLITKHLDKCFPKRLRAIDNRKKVRRCRLKAALVDRDEQVFGNLSVASLQRSIRSSWTCAGLKILCRLCT